MLYQKIRPKSFDQIVGNKSAVAALRRAADNPNKRAHCYLLAGPSGCGKTTMARIAAEAFGCDLKIDLDEINAASNRGIDMARDLERRSATRPFSGGNRVVVIDESHMLTREAQNALLKVLEDIPDWLYYILCSTEPNRLINTVRTRAELIEVQNVSPDEIFDLLNTTITNGHVIDPGEDVLNEIADNSKGCPRRALMMLEKVDGMSLKEALVSVQTYEETEKSVKDVCCAVLNCRWDHALRAYKLLHSPQPEEVRRATLGYLKSVLLSTSAKDDGKIKRIVQQIEELSGNTYDSGEAGLLAMIVLACGV